MRDLLLLSALLLLLAAPVRAEEQTLSDPTMPPSGLVVPANGPATEAENKDKEALMILNQTLVSHDSRLAVINQQSLREGDHLFGWEIRHIQPGRVVLDDGKSQKILTTAPGGVKNLMRNAP